MRRPPPPSFLLVWIAAGRRIHLHRARVPRRPPRGGGCGAPRAARPARRRRRGPSRARRAVRVRAGARHRPPAFTSIALASRVGRLEAEAAGLRAQLAQRDDAAEDLRARRAARVLAGARHRPPLRVAPTLRPPLLPRDTAAVQAPIAGFTRRSQLNRRR